MADFTITVDWGARSEQVRRQHSDLRAQRSFLLAEAPLPVAVGVVEAAQAAQWDTATLTPLPVTSVTGASKATVTIPGTAKQIRLDFELRVTIGGTTSTCLAFRQLFTVAASGALAPHQYSFAQLEVHPSSGGFPHTPTVVPTVRRSFLGASPLVTVAPGMVTINCEFLDVTELWWATWADKDVFGWYLNPAFGGRPGRLRVLAWTSGTAPMLWFVSVSDKAADGNAPGTIGTKPADKPARPGADIVFFRAPAGFNSFFYTADKSGFLNPKHGDPNQNRGGSTMFHLARWLLTPQPPAVVAAEMARSKTGGRPIWPELAGMRFLPRATTPKIDPADPMDLMTPEIRWAFRPVGVESALLHAPAEDIAVLPLSFDGFGGFPQGGYSALQKRDTLDPILRSIWHLLWMRGAVHTKDTATPARNRQTWLLANSGANIPMAGCLRANAATIDRVISCDATPPDGPKGNLVPHVIPALKAANELRGKQSKPFKVFMLTTPNMWANKAAYLHRKSQIDATGADVGYLPGDAEWDDYWTYPPTAAGNPLLFDLLSSWHGKGLEKSKRFGTVAGGRQFLFWHEWSVDGGHLEIVTNPAPAPPTPRVRSWLEDILGM
ncbi:hypothetical protein V7968_37750 [Nocardia vulneris]|uniref:hypothetical protein n=1 Tax=Nocardia vulneris TaxID=1141657 RepID=UPI0030D2C64B